jgi:hypothetical protein
MGGQRIIEPATVAMRLTSSSGLLFRFELRPACGETGAGELKARHQRDG